MEEFPLIVSLARQFDMRDFEVITVRLDEPRQQSKVQAFLQKQGAGLTKRKQDSVSKEGRKTNNYRFTGTSQDALVSALNAD